MNELKDKNLKVKPITQVADDLGIDPTALEVYGPYKAKVRFGQL